MERADLIEAIDCFTDETKMSAATFGKRAVNDGKFVQRLRDGGRCWPETTDKVLAFISSQRAEEAAAA